MNRIRVYQEDEDGLWLVDVEVRPGIMVTVTGDTRKEAMKTAEVMLDDSLD
jgi:hypothetical protein